jgi:hypothetical protein
MRYRRIVRITLAVVFGASTVVLAGAPKSPAQAYLDYHAALMKATKLEDVLPYLSAAYRGMLESRPKDDRPVWLARLKDGADFKDVKITKTTVHGDACTLEGTATSARGNTLHGKIHLVQEGGAWKIDDEGWAT